VLLFLHPAVRDVFCGLFPASGPSVVEQMSHGLIPVLEGTVATGGIPLHGALVERKGAGVVLLGRSGTGKTTCCRRLPPGWSVHGDDLAMALPDGKAGFRVHPLPTWSAVKAGEVRWPCRVHRSVPLRALFLLEQSDRCDAAPLDTALSALAVNRAARQALIAHGFRSYRRSRELTSGVFATSVRLAKAVPAFRLRVSLTGRFWEQIEEGIESLASPSNVSGGGPERAGESRI
jgi:SynChlorMet cassette protein ScmC